MQEYLATKKRLEQEGLDHETHAKILTNVFIRSLCKSRIDNMANYNPAELVKWKVGRKLKKLDQSATKRSVRAYMKKVGVVSDFIQQPDCVSIRHTESDGVNLFYCSGLLPFTDRYIQKSYELDIVRTKIRISRHALIRFMSRTKCFDVVRGCEILGRAITKNDRDIAYSVIKSQVIPTGYQVRQIATGDGGLIILAMVNPDENRYVNMEGTVITYVDKTMVKDFNTERMNAEYENMIKAEYIDGRQV